MMPTFKDVVDFLKERAFVLNHPFFSGGSGENMASRVKSKFKPPGISKSHFNVNVTTAKGETCPMCLQPRSLY